MNFHRGGGSRLAWTTGMDDEISIMEYRTIMKYHRGGVTTGMDDWHWWIAWLTGMDDWHGWMAWMTGIDDWTLLFISYFYILMTDRQTDWLTDRLTLVLVKSLSRLKTYKVSLSQFSVHLFVPDYGWFIEMEDQQTLMSQTRPEPDTNG